MTDAREEARARLGGGYDPRVLEPSPPAVTVEPFADDPTSGGDLVPVDRPGTESWDRLCRASGDADLSSWCADRWLGAWRRLVPLPPGYHSTVRSLHALAEHVLSPARHAATGKIGLRFTRGGFGTPFFGSDRQVRMEGPLLVIEDGASSSTAPVITLMEAALRVGVEPGRGTGVVAPTTPWDGDAPLHIDADGAAVLAAWYGFCTSVLEQLRQDAPDASGVQLWPEHFDVSIDRGDEGAGLRANFGGSPGDAGHDEPYLYAGPWVPRSGAFWNETTYASLTYRRLLEADDQRGTALNFFAQASRELQT